MALFAAVQISFAQVTGSAQHDSRTAAWNAIYIFTYGSMIMNLGGAAGAITVLYQATALENKARIMAMNRPDSLPGKVAKGGYLDKKDLERIDWALLRDFGMPAYYQVYYLTLILSFVLGCIFSFSSLSIWVWIHFPVVVGACLMPLMAIAVLLALTFALLPCISQG